MTPSTKRERTKRLDKLEEQIQSATRAENDGNSLTVKWRSVDLKMRPEGVVYDADEGVLAYDAWEAQHTTLDALQSGEHDVVAFLAGYGSGKSITGARWLVAQALCYPGSRFLAMGIDFTKARDTTFRVLFKNLPGERTDIVTSAYNGPETSPIVADYNRAEHRLTLINDSVIKLGSADRWNRYAGDEYGAIWMDEPSHYGEDLHDLLEMIGSRLRGVAGPKVMFWTLTGNGYNAAWEILEKRRDASGDPIGLRIEVLRASTLDNPYLSDGEKARFERQYSGTDREEQALHGGFEAAQGLVYSQFSRDTHVLPHTDADELVEDDWRIYGYDAGWRDPRVLVEIGKTAYDQFLVLNEFYERNAHVEDAIRWLKENDKPQGSIYCEHEPSDIEKFTRSGYSAAKAAKSLDGGISEVRKRLEADENIAISSKKKSIVPIRSYRVTKSGRTTTPRDAKSTRKTTEDETENDSKSDLELEESSRVGLLVSDRCEHLIREFLSYKEEHVGKSNADDHCLDSLRYCLHTHTTANSTSSGCAVVHSPSARNHTSNSAVVPVGAGNNVAVAFVLNVSSIRLLVMTGSHQRAPSSFQRSHTQSFDPPLRSPHHRQPGVPGTHRVSGTSQRYHTPHIGHFALTAVGVHNGLRFEVVAGRCELLVRQVFTVERSRVVVAAFFGKRTHAASRDH